MKCRECRFSYLLKNELWCDYISEYVWENSSCEHGEFPKDYDEPQTNADHIRAMSDEELAEAIDSDFNNTPWCDNECSDKCIECIIKWLKEKRDC